MSVKKLWMQNLWKQKWFLFSLVGGSGVIVNALVFHLLIRLWNASLLPSSWIASFTAMTSNFLLNHHITWRDAKTGQVWSRFFKFMMVSAVGIFVSSFVLYALHLWVGIYPEIANLAGILAAMSWNYLMNQAWTFKKRKERAIPSRH